MVYDVEYVRKQFPALELQVNGQSAAFLDGPGGTQVPKRVIDAMVHYLIKANANAGGAFLTSRESDKILEGSRDALADFLGADKSEVSFGQNTTSLMFSLALAIGRERTSRDEIVITQMDHEANRGPWEALSEMGFTIKEVKIDPLTCTIDMEDYRSKLSQKTRLAAFSYASNAVGTVSDVKTMVNLAHQVGALTVADAVHYALHGPLDVKELGVDFLLCSAYKFFGPHIGVFYGKKESYESIDTYRLQVQSDIIPHRIETGTLNHEGIAGAKEAVEFIADLGVRFGESSSSLSSTRRSNIVAGMRAMEKYEQPMAEFLTEELSNIEGITVYAPPKGHPRTSTVSFKVTGINSRVVAEILGDKGLFVWSGHFYAARLVKVLGLDKEGGLVRVGLSPYNTMGEIERLLCEVRKIVRH